MTTVTIRLGARAEIVRTPAEGPPAVVAPPARTTTVPPGSAYALPSVVVGVSALVVALAAMGFERALLPPPAAVLPAPAAEPAPLPAPVASASPDGTVEFLGAAQAAAATRAVRLEAALAEATASDRARTRERDAALARVAALEAAAGDLRTALARETMGRHRHEAATDAMVYQGMREATASADRRAADLAAAARRHATDLAAAEQRHADALGGERKRYDALAEATAELAGLLEASVETRVEPVRRMLASVGFEGATLGRVLRNAPAAGGPFVPLPRGATDLAERLPEQASARLRAAFDGMLSLGTLCHLAERIPAGMPVSATGTSSGFGRRIDPFTGQQALHTGVDLNAPTGTPVTTRAPGRVSDVSRHPEYGLFVDVDHGYGILTRYAHLSTALVRKGSPVEAGNTIGLVGLTGRTTGEHLHYEVVLGGRPVDPVSYLGARRHVCETR